MDNILEDTALMSKSIIIGPLKYPKLYIVDFIKFLLFSVLVSQYMLLSKDTFVQVKNVQ